MNILKNSCVSVLACRPEAMDAMHRVMYYIHNPYMLVNTVYDQEDPNIVYMVGLIKEMPDKQHQQQLIAFFAEHPSASGAIAHTVHMFEDGVETIRMSFADTTIDLPYDQLFKPIMENGLPLEKTAVYAIYPQKFDEDPTIGFKSLYQVDYPVEDMAFRESKTPLMLMGLHRNGFWIQADSYKQLGEVINDESIEPNIECSELFPILLYGDSAAHKPIIKLISQITMVCGPLLISTWLDMLKNPDKYQYLIAFFDQFNGAVPTRAMVEDIISSQEENIGFKGTVPLPTDEHIGEHPRPTIFGHGRLQINPWLQTSDIFPKQTGE